MKDYDLSRFLEAQERDYQTALNEIKNGAKVSHWIWYIFPKLKGHGGSYYSQYYGLNGEEEARAYLEHPILGARLREITQALLLHSGKRTILHIMGSNVDVNKLRRCMTLFDGFAPNDVFAQVLDAFYTRKTSSQQRTNT